MLVLSRKLDEKIVIEEGRIEILVIEIRGDVVRLGISAPAEVLVDRQEIHELRIRDTGKER